MLFFPCLAKNGTGEKFNDNRVISEVSKRKVLLT